MNATIVSTLVLGSAWFAAVNIIASSMAWVAADVVLRMNGARRAGALLAIRLFPAALSIFFVAALFLPAHWTLEPADAQESFGIVLYGLSALGAALLLRSAARVAAVARAGRRLRACERLAPIDRTLGAYEVTGLAGVSLAGVFRTRILVGDAVRRALTAAELDVALAHERAHRGALDNMKRFVMFCAPDLFGGSAPSHQIEARWRATAEWLADARAVDGDQARAVQLASALVKVSRLASMPSGFVTSPAWSTLHDPPLLEMRVRRLVHGNAPAAERPHALCGAACGTLFAAVLLSWAPAIAPTVHQLTETLVRLLP